MIIAIVNFIEEDYNSILLSVFMRQYVHLRLPSKWCKKALQHFCLFVGIRRIFFLGKSKWTSDVSVRLGTKRLLPSDFQMVSNGPGHGYLLHQNLYFSPACWCLSQSTPANCSAESPLCGCSCGQRPVKTFQKRQLEIIVVFLPGSNLIIFKLSLACCPFFSTAKEEEGI